MVFKIMKCLIPVYILTPSCDCISKIRTNEKIFYIVYLSEHAAPRSRSWSLAQSGPRSACRFNPAAMYFVGSTVALDCM